MGDFQLIPRILSMSATKTWCEAVKEWKPVRVYDREGSQCLCGKVPITQVNEIWNSTTQRNAEIGRCCIRKFMPDVDEGVRSVGRVRKNVRRALDPSVVDAAFQRNIISEKSLGFYLDTADLPPSRLSEKQVAWRSSVNERILANMTNNVKKDESLGDD